jgi:hypothetical protein
MNGKPGSSLIPVILAGVLASGCVIVPRTREGYDPECRFVTHSMELQAVQVSGFKACGVQGHYAGGDLCVAAWVASLGVTAASAVVSGSIVVVGNVAYWAERRLNCAAPTVAADAPRA